MIITFKQDYLEVQLSEPFLICYLKVDSVSEFLLKCAKINLLTYYPKTIIVPITVRKRIEINYKDLFDVHKKTLQNLQSKNTRQPNRVKASDSKKRVTNRKKVETIINN
jgi:hypothetical protein